MGKFRGLLSSMCVIGSLPVIECVLLVRLVLVRSSNTILSRPILSPCNVGSIICLLRLKLLMCGLVLQSNVRRWACIRTVKFRLILNR